MTAYNMYRRYIDLSGFIDSGPGPKGSHGINTD